MQNSEIKSIAIALLADISNGDVAGIAAKLTEDAVWITPSDPRVFKFAGTHSRQEFLDVMQLFTGFFSQKLTFTALVATCEGNRVALEAEARGVAQQIPFFNRYHFLFEFRGNRIAVAKEYMDSAFAVWFNAEITRRTATSADSILAPG